MIFVQSFTNTDIQRHVSRVVKSTTDEMSDWIDDMEGNVIIAEKDTGEKQELRVISTSTQLLAIDDSVSYVITVVAEIRQKDK